MKYATKTWLALVSALAVLATGGLLAACSDEDDSPEFAPDPALIAYLDETFGVALYGWADEDELPVVNADGFIVMRAEGSVRVTGFGERALTLEEEIAPAADGGEIFLKITDVESGDQRTFLYNYDEGYIVFGQDTGPDSRGVGVQRNPDGTHEVWTFDDAVSDRTDTRTVADGYAAMREVEAFNQFSAVHPHILMMAVALGHTEPPEARFPIDCNKKDKDGRQARTPSACSIFKAFCDCSACLVLDRGGDCALCPQL